MDDRYGTDVLAKGWRAQFQRELRRVPADRDLVVEFAAGRLLRRRHGRAVGHRRARGPPRSHAGLPARRGLPHRRRGRRPRAAHGRRARRLRRGPPPAPSPSPTPAPGSRGRAASSSRVAMTPNSSRRCGATTCGSRASWWSTCRVSTCSRPRSTRSRRARSAATACWWTTSSPGSKESRITDAILRGRHGAHLRIVGHPYIDVWQCVTPRARRHRGVARSAPRHRVQGRRVPGPRLACARSGRHRAGLAADPRLGEVLPRPRAVLPRPRRRAHRLRDGLTAVRGHGALR